jgi:hypothetical protein
MSELSKQALKVENNTSFPNNNAGLITPSNLRTFNEDMIDSTVNQATYTTDSASFDNRIDTIASGSTGGTGILSSSNQTFVQFSSSVDTRLDSLESFSSSLDVTFVNQSELAQATGSLLNTASFDNNTRNLTFTKADNSQFSVNIPDATGSVGSFVTTQSFQDYTSSNDGKVNSLINKTGSYATTGSNNFIGNETITGSLIVSSSTTQNQIIGVNGGFGTGTRVTGRFEVNGPLHAQQDAYVGSLYIANTLNKNGAGDLIVGSNLRLEDPNNPAGSQNPINLIVSGSTNITGSLTASLQQGYAWVGGAGNVSKAVPTSSFGGGGSTDTGSLMVTGSVNVNVLTFTKGDGSTFNLTVASSGSAPTGTVSGSQQIIDLGFVTTSSFQSYTSSNDGKVTSLINATGSYATTGSNTFTGTQTFNDTITANSTASLFNSVKLNNSLRTTSNFLQLDVASGSIVLSAPNSIPSLSQLGFVSSSNLAGQVNLIFRNGSATTDLILSGSNNILGIPGTPSAGFKKYLSDNNLIMGSRTPEITGSAAFSPNLSGNIIANQTTTALFLRAPISSSTYTLTNNFLLGQINLGTSATNNYEKAISGTTLTQNALIGGTFNATAFTTNLTNSPSFTSNVQMGGATTVNQISSSLTLTGNLLGSTALVFNNEYSSSGLSVASSISPRTNFNLFSGFSHGVTFSGTNTSTSQTKEFSGNIVVGTFNSASVPTGDRCNIVSTGLIGNSLVITGSSTTGASTAARTYDGTQGSMFVGRYNAVNGTRNLTAETVFAVGTGNSLSNRKTGFLIDSGSNTFVEGSLNVSGSTSLSGSFYIQSSSANLPEATGSGVLTYDQSNGQVKFTKYTELLSASFDVGGFQTNVTNSGSAAVSQSINFEITDVSKGIVVQNNSQIKVQQSGTYLIIFSAQLECSAGADTIWIWLKKNGTNVAESTTKSVMPNNTAQTMTVNFMLELVANDYIELVWQNLNGNGKILAENGSGNYPAIPAVILTINQVH